MSSGCRKLIIHPTGNKSKRIGEYISAYLAMSEVNSLPPGWEVFAIFRIFLLDQHKDNYLKLEGLIIILYSKIATKNTSAFDAN